MGDGLTDAIGGLLGVAIVADVAGKMIKNKPLSPKPVKLTREHHSRPIFKFKGK